MSFWLYSTIALLLFVDLRLWQAALLSVSLGLAAAGTLMNTSHDAVHGTLTDNQRVGAVIAVVTAPFGISRKWWQAKHNVFHHGYTNVAGMDDDISFGSLARFSPVQEWRPWHRYQHLYLWALYPFLYFAMAMSGDHSFIFHGRVGDRDVARPTVRRAATLLLEKLAGISLILGLAFWRRPAGVVLASYATAGVVAGFVLAVSFQIEHVVDTSSFPRPDDDGVIDDEWARTQVTGAADVATGNRVYTWYVGGLNFHIEHHLFPRLPHTVLPTIAPLVRAACDAHGIPHAEFATVTAAVRSHQRMLQRLGAAPSRPVVTQVASAAV